MFWLYFRSARDFTRFVLGFVKFSVMKILLASFLRFLLELYTSSRHLYDKNLTMTWDFPFLTLPITCDRLMSLVLMSSLSLFLQISTMMSSVLTGWMIWPLLSTGTSMLWNRRLVLLEYCSWCSRRTSKLLTMSCKESISLSFSFNDDFKCWRWWCSHYLLCLFLALNEYGDLHMTYVFIQTCYIFTFCLRFSSFLW